MLGHLRQKSGHPAGWLHHRNIMKGTLIFKMLHPLQIHVKINKNGPSDKNDKFTQFLQNNIVHELVGSTFSLHENIHSVL